MQRLKHQIIVCVSVSTTEELPCYLRGNLHVRLNSKLQNRQNRFVSDAASLDVFTVEIHLSTRGVQRCYLNLYLYLFSKMICGWICIEKWRRYQILDVLYLTELSIIKRGTPPCNQSFLSIFFAYNNAITFPYFQTFLHFPPPCEVHVIKRVYYTISGRVGQDLKMTWMFGSNQITVVSFGH